MNKTLIILRGLPGSGKSTFAKLINGDRYLEADQYFSLDGEYKFDASKLKDAHQWCMRECKRQMEWGFPTVVVSNTSTTEKELHPYLDLANEFDYRVVSVVVENRHGNSNIHNVPQETLQKMKDRFQIKLI